MRFLFLCSILYCSFPVHGQEYIPCYAISPQFEDISETIKSDSLGYRFVPKTDTTIVVYVSSDRRIYRHFRRETMQVLVEGDFGGRIYTDIHRRFGKWTEYFDNGIIKTTGYYYESKPIGLWRFYYPNGNLKETYSISLIESDPSSSFCKTGSYQCYYENGNLKVNGFYRATVDSTTEERFDFITGETYIATVRKPISKPYGIWTFYSEDGSLEREEDFEEEIDPLMWYFPKD